MKESLPQHSASSSSHHATDLPYSTLIPVESSAKYTLYLVMVFYHNSRKIPDPLELVCTPIAGLMYNELTEVVMACSGPTAVPNKTGSQH